MISEVAGGADELRKIRGVLFTPVSVEEHLREEFPAIEEYEIIVDSVGVMDEIALRVEPQKEVEDSALKTLSVRLSERLKTRAMLRFNLSFAPPGALPRHTLKSRRFEDQRGGKRVKGEVGEDLDWYRLGEVREKIEKIGRLVLDLKVLGRGMPVIEKNTVSMLGLLYVLRSGVSDVAEIMDNGRYEWVG